MLREEQVVKWIVSDVKRRTGSQMDSFQMLREEQVVKWIVSDVKRSTVYANYPVG